MCKLYRTWSKYRNVRGITIHAFDNRNAEQRNACPRQRNIMVPSRCTLSHASKMYDTHYITAGTHSTRSRDRDSVKYTIPSRMNMGLPKVIVKRVVPYRMGTNNNRISIRRSYQNKTTHRASRSLASSSKSDCSSEIKSEVRAAENPGTADERSPSAIACCFSQKMLCSNRLAMEHWNQNRRKEKKRESEKLRLGNCEAYYPPRVDYDRFRR